MKPALAIIFLAAVAALVAGIERESWPLVAVSALASLTIVAVGVAAGGWSALKPWRSRS